MKIILSILLVTNILGANIAHKHSAYNHDARSGIDNSSWMSTIDNNTLVSRISIPGTHDTMSLYGGILPQCQALTLEMQLRAGIRAFDIRCRHYYNTFTIHHEEFYQKTNFSNVLNTMIEFLEENPTEVLLMRVKEEFTPEGNTQNFDETFGDYYTDVYYSNYFWEPTNGNPALQEVRGKIIVLQNFGSSKDYGIPYNSLDIQDYYGLQSNWDLYNKWNKIKDQLRKANSSNNGFYMNYLSGSTGFIGDTGIPLVVFPFFVVSGHIFPKTNSPNLLTGYTTKFDKNIFPDFPRVLCTIFCLISFEGTNILTYDYLQQNKPTFVGIIMSDFPGDGFISSIINLNKR